MKHRPFLWITLLFLSIAAFSNIAVATQSIDADAPLHPETMAQYFPADTDVWLSVRIDESFVDQLDQFALLVTGAFGAYDVPSLSLRDVLLENDTDIDALLPWLGDYAAVGMRSILQPRPSFNDFPFDVVAQIEDEAAARTFLATQGFVDYSDDIMINIQRVGIQFLDGAIVMSERLPVQQDEASLSENVDFQRVVDALPADGYNAIAYATENAYDALMRGMDIAYTGEENPLGTVNDAALGLTVLDGHTYTIDSAQLPLDGAELPAVAAIDPAFTHFIPASADLFVQSTGLSTLIDGGLDIADRLTSPLEMVGVNGIEATVTPPSMPSPRQQVESGLLMLGIDLNEDVLSWTTGNFAFFGRADVREIATSIIREESAEATLQDRYDFGMIVEATDAAKAQELAASLNTLIQQMVGNAPEVEIGSETINGVSVTTIDIFALVSSYPEAVHLPLNLMLGASDEFFFFGTRGAVSAALEGGESLADTEAYSDAGRYFLPNPVTIAYTNDEGFVGLLANPTASILLTLSDPAIGSVFSSFVNTLQTPSFTPTPTPTPTPSPTPDVDSLLSPLDYAISRVHHSTMSATITEDGITLIRLTTTLNG